MSLQEDFEKASKDVMNLAERPDNQTLLTLYALFKQATDGDISGQRPGILDIKGRKKFDAWAGKRGVSKEVAMKEYVAMVRRQLTEKR